MTPAVAPGELTRVKFRAKLDDRGLAPVFHTVRQTGPARRTGTRSWGDQQKEA